MEANGEISKHIIIIITTEAFRSHIFKLTDEGTDVGNAVAMPSVHASWFVGCV